MNDLEVPLDWGIPALTDRFGDFAFDLMDMRLLTRRIEPHDGLTLREALLHYDSTGLAEELVETHKVREAVRQSVKIRNVLAEYAVIKEWQEREPVARNALSGDQVSLSPEERFVELRSRLEFQLLKKLCSGALVATGYSHNDLPDEPARVILVDRWRALAPDYKLSSAKGGGLRLSGILVYEPAHLRPPQAVPRGRFSMPKLEQWYVKWIEHCARDDHVPTSNEDLQAVRAEFGSKVPRDAVRGIRRNLAPAHWKKRGRPRKARVPA